MFGPKKYILKQNRWFFQLFSTDPTMYRKINFVFVLSMKIWKNTLTSRILWQNCRGFKTQLVFLILITNLCLNTKKNILHLMRVRYPTWIKEKMVIPINWIMEVFTIFVLLRLILVWPQLWGLKELRWYNVFLPTFVWFSKVQCDNYVPQWWVEFGNELSWLFTNRFRATWKLREWE